VNAGTAHPSDPPRTGLAVLAVDDEPRALADVERLLAGSPWVGSIDTAGGGREALVKLGAGAYDVLFLDVQMPEIAGLDLAQILRRFDDPPEIVFLTGHADAAVAAFEVQALDFLVKPVTRDRLDAALARVADVRTTRAAAPSAQATTPSAPEVVALDNPDGPGKRLVRLESIRSIEADGDYARIHTADGVFTLRAPLGQLEEDWAAAGFTRVHRAHVVNLTHAVELRSVPNGTAELVLDDGTHVPVARRSVAALRRRLKA
jgi:DNA-binding LytR/AlgR family response regulator